MHALRDLDLYDLPMESPAFAANPYPHLALARQRHPWLARCSNGYCIIEYQAMKDLMSMDNEMSPPFDTIVALMQAEGTPWGRFTAEQMIALPDREHRLLRGTFVAQFTPRMADSMRGMMREIMGSLLDRWTPRAAIDFEEFAAAYPVSVMARMIGAPLQAIPALHRSLEVLGLGMSLNKELLPRLNEAILHIEGFCETLMEDRRAAPNRGAPDLLDLLIEASDGEGLSRRQLVDLLMFLFIAGYDTSKNVLTYMMFLMIGAPRIYERCAADLDYCRKCVEEALRVFSPGLAFRRSKVDVAYRDVQLPKDTMLFVLLSVAGHDPAVCDDADKFDPERPTDPQRRHIAFGLGKHTCLGQHIARVQLQEGIHLIAQRMRRPRLTAEPGHRPFYGVWGLKGLPIEFDAG
jgi:cytochrome P450